MTIAAPVQAPGIDSPRAWLAVVAAFLASGVTLGIAYSFGAFFESMAQEFNATKGATAVVFSITTFSFYAIGMLTGRMVDRYGPRPVLILGAVALGSGLLITAEAQSLTVGYITYGLGVGTAVACAYVPMVAVVGAWFEQKRAVAVGVAVAGIGIGTMVMSPLSAALVDAYGWRTAYRIFGVGGAALLLFVCVPLIDRAPGHTMATRRPFSDALDSPTFRRLTLSVVFLGLALFIPFVFVGQYAKLQGVGSVQAAVLVGLLGGSSVVARVGIGTQVERHGSFRLYHLCLAVHASSYLLWLAAGSSFAMLVAFVIVLGVGYGGFVALGPLIIADLLGLSGLGSMLSMFYLGVGVGGLFGPPLGGWLIDNTDGYTTSILFSGVAAVVSMLLVVGLPTDDSGRIQRATTASG